MAAHGEAQAAHRISCILIIPGGLYRDTGNVVYADDQLTLMATDPGGSPQ